MKSEVEREGSEETFGDVSFFFWISLWEFWVGVVFLFILFLRNNSLKFVLKIDRRCYSISGVSVFDFRDREFV